MNQQISFQTGFDKASFNTFDKRQRGVKARASGIINKGRRTSGAFLYVSLLLMLFLFTACSSAPSVSDGKEFFDSNGKKQNLFKVKNFTKTNAVGDEKIYTMEYETELECLKANTTPPAPGEYLTVPVNDLSYITCMNKGEIVKRKGALVFEKTEKGWRILPDKSK